MKSLTLKPVMNKNMPKQIKAVALKIRQEKPIAPLVQGYFDNDIRLMIEIGKSHWIDYISASVKSANNALRFLKWFFR